MSRTTIMMTNILPHDLVVDILSRLPVKTLLRFRCVSKSWKIFFSDPSFIKMHLNHSINNYQHILLTNHSKNNLYCIADNVNSTESSLADEVVEIDYPFKTPTNRVGRILDSCYGLLLIMITSHLDIECIWNPSTKEFKKLPPTPIEYPKNYTARYGDHIAYGFGYDKIIDDYKVVRIVRFNNFSSEVKVYTLGSNSWRRIQDLPEYLTLLSCEYEGHFANGAIHWLAGIPDDKDDEECDEFEKKIILSLNIEDEKYEEIQQPIYPVSTHHFWLDLKVLGGCLSIFWSDEDFNFGMLVMKEYGVKESWTKIFPPNNHPKVVFFYDHNGQLIPSGEYNFKPIKFTKNGEIFIANGTTSLILYDPKRGTEKHILEMKPGVEKYPFHAYTYVESLISLNSGTFVGKEQQGMSISHR